MLEIETPKGNFVVVPRMFQLAVFRHFGLEVEVRNEEEGDYIIKNARKSVDKLLRACGEIYLAVKEATDEADSQEREQPQVVILKAPKK